MRCFENLHSDDLSIATKHFYLVAFLFIFILFSLRIKKLMINNLTIFTLHSNDHALNTTYFLLSVTWACGRSKSQLNNFVTLFEINFMLDSEVKDLLWAIVHVKMGLSFIVEVCFYPFAPHAILELEGLHVGGVGSGAST